jgi:hypothetical protein
MRPEDREPVSGFLALPSLQQQRLTCQYFYFCTSKASKLEKKLVPELLVNTTAKLTTEEVCTLHVYHSASTLTLFSHAHEDGRGAGGTEEVGHRSRNFYLLSGKQ